MLLSPEAIAASVAAHRGAIVFISARPDLRRSLHLSPVHEERLKASLELWEENGGGSPFFYSRNQAQDLYRTSEGRERLVGGLEGMLSYAVDWLQRKSSTTFS